MIKKTLFFICSCSFIVISLFIIFSVINNYSYPIPEKVFNYYTSLQWKKLKCGLSINKNNDIGFKTSSSVYRMTTKIDSYITKFGYNENPPLKDVIDTLSFYNMGNLYFKDKNHIYHFYPTICGGSFYILDEADHKTFEILGDCYAKDKNNIYEYRKGKLDSVDYATFKTKKGLYDCFAKDKYGYLSSGERINIEEYLEEDYIKEVIKALEN